MLVEFKIQEQFPERNENPINKWELERVCWHDLQASSDKVPAFKLKLYYLTYYIAIREMTYRVKLNWSKEILTIQNTSKVDSIHF